MNALRRHRLALARLLAGALVLAALAPSVARALAFSHGQIAPWSVLCSAGSGSVPAPGSDDRTVAHLLDHCSLCVLATQVPGLTGAPATPSLPPVLQAAPVVPVLRQALLPRPIWRRAAPRAPPALA